MSKITLENIIQDDFDDIYALTTDYEIMKYVGNRKIWTKEKVQKNINYSLEEVKQSDKERENYYYKIVDKNKFIGVIAFHKFIKENKYLEKTYDKDKRDEFFLTIFIKRSEQGKGYFSKSVKLLIEKMKHHQPFKNKLYIWVRASNINMNKICFMKYKFIGRIVYHNEVINEYCLYYHISNPEMKTYMINTKYFTQKEIDSFFGIRENWIEYNPKSNKVVDFMYVDHLYEGNKSLWKYKSVIKNIVDYSKVSIGNKDILMDNLLKLNMGAEKYLMNQYKINLKNVLDNNTNLDEFKKYFKNNKIWIFKPIDGFSGKRIEVFNDYNAFKQYSLKMIEIYKSFWKQPGKKGDYYQRWVLQEYIIDPLLVQNKKMHIRVYFLYSRINGKKCGYISNVGEIALAKSYYQKNDWSNKDIHDTHFPIDRDSLAYPMDLIKSHPKINIDKINQQIQDLANMVVKCINAKCLPEAQNCYEIFGVDLMITSNLEVKLIEINFKTARPPGNRDKMNIRGKIFSSELETIVDEYFPPKYQPKIKNIFIKIC